MSKRHVERFKLIQKSDVSLMHRVGRFVLTRDELDSDQGRALEIFSECIVLEARALHPMIMLPTDVDQKIIYIARCRFFDPIKTTSQIPWYLWTLEDYEGEDADLSGMKYLPMRISAPAFNYR